MKILIDDFQIEITQIEKGETTLTRILRLLENPAILGALMRYLGAPVLSHRSPVFYERLLEIINSSEPISSYSMELHSMRETYPELWDEIINCTDGLQLPDGRSKEFMEYVSSKEFLEYVPDATGETDTEKE